ncbi:MAG: corrinoid protein [Candidatus Methanosuratus sp.]|nr:corrinoid protein [Candidatus Methanosuratincola sp.]
MSEAQLFEELAKAVYSGDDAKAVELSKKAISAGMDPLRAINEGLMKGMGRVGDDFSQLKIYLPEVMLAADAMKAALSILEPEALKRGGSAVQKSRVVIATITGDIHDIGKNIVAMLMRANGFQVYDLGRDVPIDELVKKAEEVKADFICASTLLSTSMPYMEDLIALLKERGIREKYLVMVGGGPVTREWAASIGADGYGDDGDEAVKAAKELLQRRVSQ